MIKRGIPDLGRELQTEFEFPEFTADTTYAEYSNWLKSLNGLISILESIETANNPLADKQVKYLTAEIWIEQQLAADAISLDIKLLGTDGLEMYSNLRNAMEEFNHDQNTRGYLDSRVTERVIKKPKPQVEQVRRRVLSGELTEEERLAVYSSMLHLPVYEYVDEFNENADLVKRYLEQLKQRHESLKAHEQTLPDGLPKGKLAIVADCHQWLEDRYVTIQTKLDKVSYNEKALEDINSEFFQVYGYLNQIEKILFYLSNLEIIKEYNTEIVSEYGSVLDKASQFCLDLTGKNTQDHWKGFIQEFNGLKGIDNIKLIEPAISKIRGFLKSLRSRFEWETESPFGPKLESLLSELDESVKRVKMLFWRYELCSSGCGNGKIESVKF